MMKPRAPIATIPRPVIITTFEYSSEVGFRAIFRTRPYFPLPRRLTRSSIRRWTSQLLSTMSAMVSPHDVVAALGPDVFPGSEDLLGADPGQDQHDAQPMLEARIDGGAPDDACVPRDPALDDLGDLLRLGHAHVVPAGDVHEGAGRAADVDVDEGRIDRFLDRLLGAVVRIRLAEPDHRHASTFHDRLDVVEVQVDQARLRDDLGDPFDRPQEHIVRHFERLVQRYTLDDVKHFVVRDHDDGV